jgi:hypothetical protein
MRIDLRSDIGDSPVRRAARCVPVADSRSLTGPTNVPGNDLCIAGFCNPQAGTALVTTLAGVFPMSLRPTAGELRPPSTHRM